MVVVMSATRIQGRRVLDARISRRRRVLVTVHLCPVIAATAVAKKIRILFIRPCPFIRP
jgi:hypothetical protein